MNKYVEVINRTVELAETIQEGLEFIQSKLSEAALEDTSFMLNNVIQGIDAIQASLEPMIKEMNIVMDETAFNRLLQSLDNMVQAYEQNDQNKAVSILDSSLIRSYGDWKRQLCNVLEQYTLS